MVFENKNKDTLCYLENKVNSSENYVNSQNGENQLNKYAKILEDNNSGFNNLYLRYCTKRRDIKNKDSYRDLKSNEFKQFRWQDIYKFFEENFKDNTLVGAFLTYLSEKNMKNTDEFIELDVTSMGNLPILLTKLEYIIEEIIDYIKEKYNISISLNKKGLYEELSKGRYSIFINNIMEDQNGNLESTIGIGFSIEEQPILHVDIGCQKDHQQYSIFKNKLDNLKGNNSLVLEEYSNWGILGWFEKPMNDFLENDSQHKNMIKWFEENIDILMTFIRNSKEIKWTLDI